MTDETKKPKPRSSLAEKELDKLEKQFDEFDQSVKDLTQERMNMAPKEEKEPQHKISQKDISEAKDIYLKPKKTISSKEKFNENFRKDYEFAKEYVMFIAEHAELIGTDIEIWSKPFPGMPAEYWEVPTGKPVWGPRYLAEQIKNCKYHRLRTDNSISRGADSSASYYGGMVVDTTIQRLDARPASKRRSVFMSSTF